MADPGYSYTAARVLYINGVRAYSVGQEVPDTVVTAQGWVVPTDVLQNGTPAPTQQTVVVYGVPQDGQTVVWNQTQLRYLSGLASAIATGSATARASLTFDTAANWAATNPVLNFNERAVNTTDGTEKIGNGTAAWSALPVSASTVFASLDSAALLSLAQARQTANFAGLRAAPYASLTTGHAFYVFNRTTTGDGGGGFFQWDGTSTRADDNGTVLNPNGNSGAGRWIRQLHRGEVTPEMFGAKGDTQIAYATVALTSGSTTLTWPSAIFSASDVGKRLVLSQAGAASATGAVSSVPVATAGTGYTSVPTGSVAGGGANAAIYPTLTVLSAAVNAGGSGYLSGGSGTVTLTLNTGFGTQCQLTCTVTTGAVTAVSSVATGGVYTVIPTITASPHAYSSTAAGTGATFNLTMGVGSVIVGNSGSGYSLTTSTATLSGGGATTAGTLGTPVITPNLPALVTTISGYTSPTVVTLAAGVGNTGSVYRQLSWGTDDAAPINSALTALTSGGTLALANRYYGQASRINLPDDGRGVVLRGAGRGASKLVALAVMNEQVYKNTINGLVDLVGFDLEGATIALHNENLDGSHSTTHRDMLISNAAQGGSNVIWGDSAFNGQSYENYLDKTVRIANQTGYSVAYDLPTYCLENWGTDNRCAAVLVNAYQAYILNQNGDLQLGDGHAFGYPVNLAAQYGIWDKANMAANGFTVDTWAPGGAGLYRDYNYASSPSPVSGINFIYQIAQPVPGTNAIRIASGAGVKLGPCSFPTTGAGALQFVDMISQVGSPHARSQVSTPDAQFNTGPGVAPSSTATPTLAGSFGLNVHDTSTTGGNALGAGAVDLSLLRSNATMVASGTASFVAGQSNTASGYSSVAIGSSNTISGAYSHGRGQRAVDRGQTGKDVWASGLFAAAGDMQDARQIFYLNSSATTANQRLTLTGAAAAASNVGQLAFNSAWLLRGYLVGRKPSTGNIVAWRLTEVMLTIGANAASAALDQAAAWTLLSTNALAVATPSLTADTTFGAPLFAVTPPDATAWHWMMTLLTTEIA